MHSVEILGVRIDNVTYEESIRIVERFIEDGGYHQIVTPNPEFVVYASQHSDFRRVLNDSALSIPDGGGLLLAGRWLKRPLREQVRGTDLAYMMMELAAQNGYKVFLLGAAPGVAQQAAEAFEKKYPGLNIIGTFAGSASAEGDEEARREVVKSGTPDMILVAYGAPKQDYWLARNLPVLGIPVGIGVGGVFDFVSGRVRRAPSWMRRLGLEWLFRLTMQPWRWKRQLALPKFVAMVLRERFGL